MSVCGLIGLIFTIRFAAGAWREAERSADAAQQMLMQDAKRTVHELRAYVFPLSAEISGPIAPNSRVPTFTVMFENSGQTPAYDVRTNVAVIFTNPGYEPEAYGDEDIAGAIPPRGKCAKEVRSRHVLGEYEVNAIASGAIDVMLFGYVKYSSFGEEWISHFRYRYDGSGGEPVMIACPPGDHADEETQD